MPTNNQANELITADVFALANLDKGMIVGDLGCGNLGYYAVKAAKIVGRSGKVYALDILKSALEAVGAIARQNGLDNLQTVWSDLEKVGAAQIPDGVLDVAFIHNVLFQSDRDEQVLAEAKRLLKSGGQLLVVDWKKTPAPFGPPLEDRIEPETVKKIATGLGLTLSNEFTAGPYHFGLIFIK